MKDSVAFATLITSGIVIQVYEPSHGRALARAFFDEEGSDLGRETDPILPAYFCRLAELGRRVAEQNSIVVKITVRGLRLLEATKTVLMLL
jgi:hypothetical protein